MGGLNDLERDLMTELGMGWRMKLNKSWERGLNRGRGEAGKRIEGSCEKKWDKRGKDREWVGGRKMERYKRVW